VGFIADLAFKSVVRELFYMFRGKLETFRQDRAVLTLSLEVLEVLDGDMADHEILII
jgi:hypothetical protein